MAWVITAVAAFFAALLMELVATSVGELLLHPFKAPLAAIYRPPHGRFVLAGTWMIAVGATLFSLGNLGSALGLFLFVAPLPLTLLASLTYRDQARIAREGTLLPRRGNDL